MRTRKEFEVGDTVRVIEGAFASFSAVVNEIKGTLARIEVDFFGRQTPVEMPVDNLENT